jgi:hypothetical protein
VTRGVRTSSRSTPDSSGAGCARPTRAPGPPRTG